MDNHLPEADVVDALPLDDPTNYRRVHQRIKKLLDNGAVQILGHAKQRVKQRRIDNLDIANVIKYGQLVGHSRPKELWRYEIEGKTVERKDMTCIVEIDARVIVITVY